MSQSISTLLIRNLDDVFGEGDPQRRRAAIDEIFTEDAVFYEPGAVHRGRSEIDRIAGVIRATHPTFRYTPTAAPQELHNAGRVHWVFSLNVRIEKVMPVEPPAVERESISIGELVDQLRSGAAAELRSALRFKD